MERAYRPVWRTWGVLLGLTAVMVVVDVMELPRPVMVLILLGAMAVKVFLIGFEFMDLKHERPIIGMTIAFSLLFFGAFLFAFIVPDGFAVLAGGR